VNIACGVVWCGGGGCAVVEVCGAGASFLNPFLSDDNRHLCRSQSISTQSQTNDGPRKKAVSFPQADPTIPKGSPSDQVAFMAEVLSSNMGLLISGKK
jgi:hypothetical protein